MPGRVGLRLSFAACAALALALIATMRAEAHGLNLARLTLEPVDAQTLAVVWFADRAEAPPDVELGGPCTTSARVTSGALVRWRLDCPGAAKTRQLELAGLPVDADVLVIAAGANPPFVPRLLSGASTATLPWRAAADPLAGLGDYLGLGATHVLGGADHLLFLLALVLLIARPMALAGVVTAFTLGHALTLVLVASGHVAVDTTWAEIAIALTLIVAARELHRAATGEVIATLPAALTAMAFGLVHGLGFASALQAGLPSMPSTLLGIAAFNLGVEAGQLAFVVIAYAVLRGLRSAQRIATPAASLRLMRGAALAIGAAGVFWCIGRMP